MSSQQFNKSYKVSEVDAEAPVDSTPANFNIFQIFIPLLIGLLST